MIENVAEEVSPQQIQSLFSTFGEIVSCRLYRQGIIHLSYTSRNSAERALTVSVALLASYLGDEWFFIKREEAFRVP